MKKFLSFAALVAFAQVAPAQTITIGDPTIDPSLSVVPGAEATIRTNLETLETSINAELPKLTMKDLANATSLAGSGIGADYADTFTVASVGGQIGVAAGSDIFSFFSGDTTAKNLPTGAAQATVLLGFNLGKFVKKKVGPVDFERMRVFASFFTYSMDFPTSVDINAEVTHWSLKAQYKLFPGVGPGAARWTGVSVTSGLAQSKMEMGITTTISQSVEGGVAGLTTMSFNGNPNLSLKSSAFVIPVDVSTGVQLGYFLNLYAGLGLDFAFGSASRTGSNLGAISSTNNLVTAPVTMDEDTAGPTVANFRYFAGLGLDGKVMGLTAQFNGNVTGQLGANVGYNLYW